jgi:hypothetical protein
MEEALALLTLARYHIAQPDSLCRRRMNDYHGRRCGNGWLSAARRELGVSQAGWIDADTVLRAVVAPVSVVFVNDESVAWDHETCIDKSPLLAVFDEAIAMLQARLPEHEAQEPVAV